MNNLNEEQIKTLKNMGALNYKASLIASIMNLNAEYVENELENTKSEFYKIYNSGKDYANYLIDLKLFEMATSGDLKAIEIFEKRKQRR